MSLFGKEWIINNLYSNTHLVWEFPDDVVHMYTSRPIEHQEDTLEGPENFVRGEQTPVFW